jgi:uncharacterized membrane protein YfcA
MSSGKKMRKSNFSGMVSAAFTIMFMRIALEWRSIIFCSLGGIGGTIFGLHMVDPYLSNDEKKIFFVSIWFSFAVALYILNRQHKRKTYTKVQHFNWWKALVLLAAGFLGGIYSIFIEMHNATPNFIPISSVFLNLHRTLLFWKS